ncbi:hypothetical protein [Streptomyces sp. NPDC002215]|uniref:DUF6907 domain-containing protein n=1 Tax=Streptomyces sp. NPDC002215 TaxID=3154412 RepID=UPI0033294E58
MFLLGRQPAPPAGSQRERLPAPPVASTSADDLSHGAHFDGPRLDTFDTEHGTLPTPVLAGRINVDPYSEDPRRNVPHIHLEPFQDEVMQCLDPQEFAAVIAQVRAHCERLDELHTQLVMARAGYR